MQYQNGEIGLYQIIEFSEEAANAGQASMEREFFIMYEAKLMRIQN
jgi:hypothetical protein